MISDVSQISIAFEENNQVLNDDSVDCDEFSEELDYNREKLEEIDPNKWEKIEDSDIHEMLFSEIPKSELLINKEVLRS